MLSLACFPAGNVNAGTAIAVRKTQAIDAKIVALTVSCGGERPERALLGAMEINYN